VIQQVLALLKQASAVIGVTSEVRGFYESEILVAANCHKPIILIADEATSGVPATAFSGHPVFDNTSLEKLRYEPLARLIHYAVGDRASVQFMRRRAVEETFDAAANWVNVLMRHSRLFGFVGVPLIAMGGYLLGANSGGDFAFLVSLLRLLLFVVVFLWPIVRLMWSFVTGTRLRRIVAQKIQTQQLTNKLLLELLTSKEDRNILSSLRNLAGTSLPA
jgi:hypothetical protein